MTLATGPYKRILMKIRLLIIAAMFFAGIVFAEDAYETIDAVAGKDFTITLESNGSTGYQWQLAEPVDKNFMQLVGSKYINPQNNLPGAPGKEEWTFMPVKTGKTKISLEYVRPWERRKPLTSGSGQPLKKNLIVLIKKR